MSPSNWCNRLYFDQKQNIYFDWKGSLEVWITSAVFPTLRENIKWKLFSISSEISKFCHVLCTQILCTHCPLNYTKHRCTSSLFHSWPIIGWMLHVRKIILRGVGAACNVTYWQTTDTILVSWSLFFNECISGCWEVAWIRFLSVFIKNRPVIAINGNADSCKHCTLWTADVFKIGFHFEEAVWRWRPRQAWYLCYQ